MDGVVVSNTENCAGCHLCIMACSFFNTGSFGLADSIIKVERVGKQNRFKVTISDDCISCGRCTEYCYFGVLSEGGEKS